MKLALWEARHAAARRNYDDAARFYLQLFNELSAEDRPKYLDEFVAVLEEMGAAAASGAADYAKQIMLLLQSRVLFPHEAAVLISSAKFFFVVGRLLEAFDFAREAVTESKGKSHAHALVNFENIKSNIMDQWHWAMLNDEKRNAAYATAIRLAAIQKPFARVLDVGTGTGLLTAIARRYFKNYVYCCEVDPNMCDIAEKILKQAVIRKHSTEIGFEDVDCEEIDVVITETMDCGLLGEGIACSIYDIQRRLLSISPIIIPKSATVYACIVECPAVMDDHVTVFYGRRFVSESVTASYTSDELEPYYCFVSDEIRGGYKILSKTIEIFDVNFDNPMELEKIVSDGSTELRMTPIIRDGTAHSIVAWFRCELFPGAPVLDTGPESGSCWQQAFYPLPKPIYLHRGGYCTLKVKARKDQLLCALRDVVVPENVGPSYSGCSNSNTNNDNTDTSGAIDLLDGDECSTASGTVLPSKRTKHDNDRAPAADTIISYKNYASLDTLIVLPDNDFTLMNDRELVHFFQRSLTDIQRIEPPEKAVLLLRNPPDIYVLDITNLAALSAALVSAYPEMQFSCHNNDAIRLIHLFAPYVSNFGAFPDNLDYLMPDNSKTVEGYQLLLSKPPRTYFEDADYADILLCWPVSSHGFLLESTLNRVLSFRLSNKRATIIPSKVSVKGQIISCPGVVQRSKPCPSVYQDVDLSTINDLAISFYYDIERSALKHEIFSDPFELLTFRFDKPMPLDRTEMPEFVCLVDVPSETTITATGTVDGLLFWYDVGSGEQVYSTYSESTLARCAVYLFDESRQVMKGDKLSFKTSNYHGNLVFELLSQ